MRRGAPLARLLPMNTRFLGLGVAVLALAAGPSCSLIQNQDITYDVPAQELQQSLSGTFTTTGTFPTVDCTASASVCSMIPGTIPAGAQITCDAGATAGKMACVLHYDITLHQTIDLAQETNFPTAVTTSPVINLVTINNVGYWAGPAQKLNVATPPLDIYVGSASATSATDPGVEQLGTIASIPAGTAPSAMPDCTDGPATSASTACDSEAQPGRHGALRHPGEDVLDALQPHRGRAPHPERRGAVPRGRARSLRPARAGLPALTGREEALSPPAPATALLTLSAEVAS